MPDIQCIPQKCAFMTDKTGPPWFPWNAEYELWSFEKEANVPSFCHREQFIFPFRSVTCWFNLELVFKSVLALDEVLAVILAVSRHGFSAQFDCHPTVKFTLFGLFLFTRVAKLWGWLEIFKIFAIYVFFGFDFVWGFHFPRDSLQKLLSNFPSIFIPLKVKTQNLSWSWIFLCGFPTYVLDALLTFTKQTISCLGWGCLPWSSTFPPCWRRNWKQVNT